MSRSLAPRCVWMCLISISTAWSFSLHPMTTTLVKRYSDGILRATSDTSQQDEFIDASGASLGLSRRRAFVSTAAAVVTLSGAVANADDGEEESFASIAARASRISKELGETTPVATRINSDGRTAYDFSLPVAKQPVKFADLIRQEQTTDPLTGSTKSKVKAVLVVNIKQDDPVARKNIPELITLLTKYSENGEFVVICSPTDQGYYEPDTSALIRLKLASEYGYGINPSAVITDKVNLLGTGAHPFWRWLEGTCRTPAGLGRVEGNFEKFLLDGRTGLPLRRYPRKYMPLDIKNDIEAVLAGRPLPPAGANYLEKWRNAAIEAERDTYRFEKGLNVFDQ